MTSKSRFIASVVKTAKSDTPALPFQRGARRAASATKASSVVQLRKSA